MRKWALAFLLASISCFAQGPKNEAAVYAFGNFNPAYFATQTGNIFAGDNTGAIGYGASYSRLVGSRTSWTLLAGEDIVDAELYNGNNTFDVWSLRRYEVSALYTRQFNTRSGVVPFIFGGPGTVITHSSPKLSGTSANLALTTGFGVDVPMNNRFSWVGRMSFIDSNTGCYGDRQCHYASWSVAQDFWTGLAVRW